MAAVSTAARWALLGALAACALPRAARAEELRYDHRGALGLIVAAGLERKDANTPTGTGGNRGWGPGADLGLTIAVGYSGNELKAAGHLAWAGDLWDVGALFGWRGYFGKDQWKTFYDLDLIGHFTPHLTIGPRFGIGVQWDYLPILGTYVTLAGQIGFGQALRFGAELLVGFQFRTYVLE